MFGGQYVNTKACFRSPNRDHHSLLPVLSLSRARDLVAIAIDDIPPAAELHHRLTFDLAWRVITGVVVERVAGVDHLVTATRPRRCRHRPLQQALSDDWWVSNHERRPGSRACDVAMRVRAAIRTE